MSVSNAHSVGKWKALGFGFTLLAGSPWATGTALGYDTFLGSSTHPVTSTTPCLLRSFISERYDRSNSGEWATFVEIDVRRIARIQVSPKAQFSLGRATFVVEGDAQPELGSCNAAAQIVSGPLKAQFRLKDRRYSFTVSRATNPGFKEQFFVDKQRGRFVFVFE